MAYVSSYAQNDSVDMERVVELIRLESAPDYVPVPSNPFCLECGWFGDWEELKTEKEWDDYVEHDVPVCPECDGYEIEW